MELIALNTIEPISILDRLDWIGAWIAYHLALCNGAKGVKFDDFFINWIPKEGPTASELGRSFMAGLAQRGIPFVYKEEKEQPEESA